jgi:hypothetical protein
MRPLRQPGVGGAPAQEPELRGLRDRRTEHVSFTRSVRLHDRSCSVVSSLRCHGGTSALTSTVQARCICRSGAVPASKTRGAGKASHGHHSPPPMTQAPSCPRQLAQRSQDLCDRHSRARRCAHMGGRARCGCRGWLATGQRVGQRGGAWRHRLARLYAVRRMTPTQALAATC